MALGYITHFKEAYISVFKNSCGILLLLFFHSCKNYEMEKMTVKAISES